MGWPKTGEGEGSGSERGDEAGNGGLKSEPGLAPFDGWEGGDGADIPGPPEPQEPGVPPFDESEPEESGDVGGEGSPDDSSEKPDTDSSGKTPGGREEGGGSEDDSPGSGESAYDRFKQAMKESEGRGLGSGVGDRPLDVPLGPTLKDPENPLFRLKSPEEKVARDRMGY